MEKVEKKFTHWTNEERALLAHLVKVAMDSNGSNNLSKAVKFAAPKLGRSESACMYQYTYNVKTGLYKPLTNDEAENMLDDLSNSTALFAAKQRDMQDAAMHTYNVQILEGSADVQRIDVNNTVIIKIHDTVIIIS